MTTRIKRGITYLLISISLASILLASGIKDVANWWEIGRPFFIVWFITL